jgi:hypothetical protein
VGGSRTIRHLSGLLMTFRSRSTSLSPIMPSIPMPSKSLPRGQCSRQELCQRCSHLPRDLAVTEGDLAAAEERLNTMSIDRCVAVSTPPHSDW